MAKQSRKTPIRPIIHGGYSTIWRKALNGQVDGRTRLVKSINALRSQLTSDLGGSPSTQEKILIDRVTIKVFRLQGLETAMMEGRGEKIENLYINMSNSMRHDLLALGLERRQKEVKTLQDILYEETQED